MAARLIAKAGALIVAVLLIAGLSVSARASALKLTVGNPSLQHFDSDGDVQLDFGLTDQNGQPAGNLTPADVKVFEDGKPAKIVDFRGVGQGRPVDIVFVMDITESMQPYIDAVKQNMIAFARDLASHNRDYRLGLVTFEDYVVSKYDDCNCAYRETMTSNVNQFISWVGSLHAGGGGDIPEDQLDALAYASKFPFRPEAQVILILITDAPPHHKGDGSAHTEHDQGFWNHHPDRTADVTDLTGADVAGMLKKNGITLYAVAPPPFIAPEYAEIVRATHGRSYNIITEEGRFAQLVLELGKSIATQYSLTYRTPRPIEDGTNRQVELKVTYGGQTATAATSYQVRGVGGAVINVPAPGASAESVNMGGVGAAQLSFAWWNLAVPLIALLCLLGLAQMRFGVSREELNAIVEAQAKAPMPRMPSIGDAARRIPRPGASSGSGSAGSPAQGGAAAIAREARLTTIEPVEPIPAEYSLLKDEVLLGRGEDNDIVIPHASVSRVHARLMRRDDAYELTDLNSTNGSYVNNQQVHGSASVSNGSEVRLGNIRFILRC